MRSGAAARGLASAPHRAAFETPGRCGFRRGEHRPHSKSRQDLVFGAVHGSKVVACSIVVPAKVQQPVERVEKQLSFQRDVMLLCLAPGLGHAYHDFARDDTAAAIHVQGERQHVGRSRDVHEPLVELRHSLNANERDRQFSQRRPETPMRGPEVPTEEQYVPWADFG